MRDFARDIVRGLPSAVLTVACVLCGIYAVVVAVVVVGSAVAAVTAEQALAIPAAAVARAIWLQQSTSPGGMWP